MEATGQDMQIDLGHWLLRLIAYIIDGVIIAIIVGILWVILFLPFLLVGAFFASWGWTLVFPFVVGLLMVLYFLYAEVNWGGTLGKRILGLRVQTVKGNKVTYGQSFIRNISKIHPLLLLLDWLIGIVTPGDKRQKYSDRMAGTIVVQTNQPFTTVIPPPTPPPPPSQ